MTTLQAAPPLDRRIARTHKALRTAAIQLMEERGYDALTVNDLCERADINRGTFYNHFKDKDDLLAKLEDQVIAHLDGYQQRMRDLDLAEMALVSLSGEPLPLLVDLFDYLRSEGDFLHAVLGNGGDVRFAGRLRDSVCTNLVLTILHDKYRDQPSAFVRYYVSFFASAYLGVITRWIETGMQESSQEMARIAVRLLFIHPGESIEL